MSDHRPGDPTQDKVRRHVNRCAAVLLAGASAPRADRPPRTAGLRPATFGRAARENMPRAGTPRGDGGNSACQQAAATYQVRSRHTLAQRSQRYAVAPGRGRLRGANPAGPAATEPRRREPAGESTRRRRRPRSLPSATRSRNRLRQRTRERRNGNSLSRRTVVPRTVRVLRARRHRESTGVRGYMYFIVDDESLVERTRAHRRRPSA